MIRSYIANLEIRIQKIERCIGVTENYKSQAVTQVQNKIKQFFKSQTIHKDIKQRFEKIKKAIQKYGEVLDISQTSTKQKIQIINEDLQDLKQIASHLDTIQKLIPALNTDNYTELRSKGTSVDELMTASILEPGLKAGEIKILKYDDTSLVDVRNEHREEMNQLLELNRRVINNVNSKLELLLRKAAK